MSLILFLAFAILQLDKGMIYLLITCSILDIPKYQDKADTKYFIVLHPGKVKLKGFVHMPELAPSQDLWAWTMMHKNEEGWFSIYTKKFCNDMKNRPGLRDAIDRLEKKARDNDVLVVCFCPDVNVCHRGLIADELARRGVIVDKH